MFDPIGSPTMADRVRLFRVLITLLVLAATICICVLPMDQLPIWNGQIPGHRNQYELMAEAILEGRIDFAYGDEDALLGLENPYDPQQRQEAGVFYHWDHAYYDGHYYMYFGIVPVFLAFLPYRILTGTALTTYHATQLFAGAAIVGIFVLLHLMCKLFFKKMPYGIYLLLSAAFSVMSVWYSTAEPALYCTAITAAIALEVWSLYFFIRGVWDEQRENRQLLFAGIGAALGALVFGCRPPIALANIVVIPMLVVFLRQRKFSGRLLAKLILAALPYVIVAVGLMCYNYARFDDPFEFGQAYQLTVADQTRYSIRLNGRTLLRIFNNTIGNFFAVGSIQTNFPYLPTASVFFNFPILLLCFGIFFPGISRQLRQHHLLPLVGGLLAAVLVITAMDILWTPYLLERYRMDIYFLMAIACFPVIGAWFEITAQPHRRYLCVGLSVLSVMTLCCACLLCLQVVSVYYPDKIAHLATTLHLR